MTLGYNKYLYLTATGRNDRASNFSYFYPSISGSFVFSDVLPKTSWLTLGKARLSYAQVGNDANPYAVSRYYDIVTQFGAFPLQSTPNHPPNSRLKPELSSEVEGGFDFKFFKELRGVNVTYYDLRTENQIWNVEISAEKRYSTKIANGGTVQNQGVELSLNNRPIVTGTFSWRASLNFSKNTNKVHNLNSSGESRYLFTNDGLWNGLYTGPLMDLQEIRN